MNDEEYMKEALKEAEIALEKGDYPVGCVIVLDEKIISRARNKITSTNDRLAHAEISAIKKITHLLKENKHKLELYTTYEPCPMCFGAITIAWIKKLVWGVNLDKSGATHFHKNLPEFYKKTGNQLEIKSGVLEKECKEVFMKSEKAKKLKDKGLII